jgi:hypothetical protein
MASSLRRRYFGRYQNVLRIILIIYASLDTTSNPAKCGTAKTGVNFLMMRIDYF